MNPHDVTAVIQTTLAALAVVVIPAGVWLVRLQNRQSAHEDRIGALERGSSGMEKKMDELGKNLQELITRVASLTAVLNATVLHSKDLSV